MALSTTLHKGLVVKQIELTLFNGHGVLCLVHLCIRYSHTPQTILLLLFAYSVKPVTGHLSEAVKQICKVPFCI